MLARCYNDKHVSYHEYGGRGITVCKAWRPESDGRANAFARFVRDVGIKPTWRHTLDRRDPNQHYTLDNCRWATPKEQGVNKRDTHFVSDPRTGARIAAATLADELKISYQTLRVRMMKSGTWYALSFKEKGITTATLLKPGDKPNEPEDNL